MSANVPLSIPAEEAAAPHTKGAARSRWWARAQDYVALTRPRVLTLVLFTAPPAMVLGRNVWPSFGTLFGVLLGAALIGGGCGAINAWWEKERDRQMLRTQDRPLPAGRLEPTQALVFGPIPGVCPRHSPFAHSAHPAHDALPNVPDPLLIPSYIKLRRIQLKTHGMPAKPTEVQLSLDTRRN